MKNVRPPQFLGNVYRDLRDRRLLIPAIALVVALLAVPVLLKSHSTATSPTVAVDNAAKSDSAAIPAVVTQQLGVTQYRKRLDRLTSKNPFHQQFTAVPKPARVHVSVNSTGSSAAASSTGTGSVTPSTTSTATTASTTSAGSSTPSSGGVSPAPSTGSTQPPPTSTPPPKPPKPTLYAFRASIAVGEPGDLKQRDNVEQGVVLPSDKKPMAAFVGVKEDMSSATFVLADTVDSVKGGHCAPSPSSCSLLQLKAGQEAHLNYAPQSRRYNLKLIGIRLVPVKKLSSSRNGARNKAADSAGGLSSSQVIYGRVK